jgi:uncharacterized protein (DUF305 family)
MRHTKKLAALGIAAALVVGLSACSNDSSDDGAAGASNGATATASASDVAFAQAMIPHHQQAVAMADMALDPASGASAEVQDLATQIKAAQDPEIQQMTMMLGDWGQPTAMPGATSPGDMSGSMGHDMGGMTVSGMMSDEDMAALDGKTGAAFDQEWLAMMTEHHQGAIDMAEQAAAATLDPQVAALADDIITAQQAEIATMGKLMAPTTETPAP